MSCKLLLLLLHRNHVLLVHLDQKEVLGVEKDVPHDHLLIQSNDTENGIYRLITKLDSLAFRPLLNFSLFGEHRVRLDPSIQFTIIFGEEHDEESQEPEDADPGLQRLRLTRGVFERVGHVPWFIVLQLLDLRGLALIKQARAGGVRCL